MGTKNELKGDVIMGTSFKLPNKKVTIRYIRRKKGMAADVPSGHVIEGGMLNGATQEFTVPKQRNGYLANILTKEEKSFLEGHEGLNRDLSVYSARDFWSTRRVTLRKSDTILDLSNPIDYIDYKILLSNIDLIAPSLKDQNNKLTYKYVIIDEGEELHLEKQNFNYKKKAFKLYSSVENNANILRGILTIVNKRAISKESDITWLQAEVEKIVDKKSKQFVELLENPNYEYAILLGQSVDAGNIIVENQLYKTIDGIELSEQGEIASYDNAIKYLSNPKNQELTSFLKAKLK